jgi:hypothetical protein
VRTRLGAAALAAAGALLVSACGTVPPGAAAVVDGTEITRTQVTDLADAQCAGVALAAKQGSNQAISRKQVTQRALGLLIDIQLNLAYGKSRGLDPRPQQVAQDFSQVEPLIQALPEKYRAGVSEVFHDWAAGRDLITQVGEDTTGQTLSRTNAEQLLNAGYQKREPWIKTVSIHTNPRYGPGTVGWPGEGDSSVSKPVSSFAKSAAAQQPSASFLAGLPAGQRCG